MAVDSGLTYFVMNKILDRLYNQVDYTSPVTVYVGLATESPTRAATGASCHEKTNADGYTRKAITFSAAADRKVRSAANVAFDTATGDYEALSHWFVADSGTYGAGNVLAFGPFAAPFTALSGATPIILASTIYVGMNAGAGIGMYNGMVHSILNWIFRNGAISAGINTSYAILSKAVLEDSVSSISSTNVAALGAGAAYIIVNPSTGASPKWSAASNGAIVNSGDILFTSAAGVSTPVLSMATGWSGAAPYAGVPPFGIIHYDNVNIEDQTPVAGQPVKILSGGLNVSLT
jgi:hypothetical protein